MNVNKIMSEENTLSDIELNKIAVKFSAFCISAIIVLGVVFILLLNLKIDLFGHEFSIFDRVETHGVEVNNMTDMTVSDSVDIVIEHFFYKDDDVSIIVYGENKLDKVWNVDNEDLVLSVFNCGNEESQEKQEARQRFYAMDFDGYPVMPKQHFLYVLNYNVPDLESRLNTGAVFTLTLFQNEDFTTREIKLDFENTDGYYLNKDIPLEAFEILMGDYSDSGDIL